MMASQLPLVINDNLSIRRKSARLSSTWYYHQWIKRCKILHREDILRSLKDCQYAIAISGTFSVRAVYIL